MVKVVYTIRFESESFLFRSCNVDLLRNGTFILVDAFEFSKVYVYQVQVPLLVLSPEFLLQVCDQYTP